jgi:hypothetical protein
MNYFKRGVKRLLHRFGYQILHAPTWSTSREVGELGGYRLVDWKNSQGQLDIGAYRDEQERGNRKKIDQVWTNERNLVFMSEWVRRRGIDPKFVVCHGTRNGFEQRIFAGALHCDVIGTEISSTASQFPMNLQADFHEIRPEWDGKVDFVYSNSLDHAYDPAKALRAWSQSVRDGGFMLLEKASDSDPRGVSDLDPFGITLPNLLVFLLETLGESASIRALLDVPLPRTGATYHKVVVVGIRHSA